jgi:hypothetical protein
MTALVWDQVGERRYETGVDHGVLYRPNGAGVYNTGFAWNGLTSITESPSGAEANPQYADNIKYLNLISTEEFSATLEAFTYPDEFAECDGTGVPLPGIAIGQQTRQMFGLCYRTKVGDDLNGQDAGYKLHLIYGALASPSEKAYATVNDSPEPINFSWEMTTTPVAVGTISGVTYKPTASLVIDSTVVDADSLAALEELLYGTVGTDPSLPLPADVIALFSGSITSVFPTAPTYNNGTHTLTIPSVTGVGYYIGEELQTSGAHVITGDVFVVAKALAGYKLTQPSDSDWFFDYS